MNNTETNTHNLLRELSGPRPLRRVADIVSKPRIWSRGAKAILLDNRPVLQVTGSGRAVIVLLQPYCTLEFSSRELRNKPRLVEPFYVYGRYIYIPSLTDKA